MSKCEKKDPACLKTAHWGRASHRAGRAHTGQTGRATQAAKPAHTGQAWRATLAAEPAHTGRTGQLRQTTELAQTGQLRQAPDKALFRAQCPAVSGVGGVCLPLCPANNCCFLFVLRTFVRIAASAVNDTPSLHASLTIVWLPNPETGVRLFLRFAAMRPQVFFASRRAQIGFCH